jgi:hypothetical protein
MSSLPPPKKKWTHSSEKMMCTLWESNTLLYDPENRHYRDTEMKAEVMDQIAEKIKMDGKI